MVRLIKESEINPKNSYFTVIAMYYADDGAPSYLKGVVVHEVFDTGLPYDKQYYKGDTFFSEKSFYDEDEAYAYKNKLVKYGTPVSESAKHNKSRMKEARIGRTKEVKVLQGNWGYGWDDLCEYDKYDNGECKADLKSYQENDPSARYRVIFRRVPNKDYVPTED